MTDTTSQAFLNRFYAIFINSLIIVDLFCLVIYIPVGLNVLFAEVKMLAFFSILFVVFPVFAQDFDFTHLRSNEKTTLAEIETLKDKLKPIHEELTSEKQTSWMRTFPNDVNESFNEFKVRVPSEALEAAKHITTIAFVPVGDFSEDQHKVLEETSKLISIFYGMHSRWYSPLKMTIKPNSKGQVHAKELAAEAEKLHSQDPNSPLSNEEVVSIVLITDKDLYFDGLNFIFGVSLPESPYIVWSFNRFGDLTKNEDEKKLFIQRSFKITAHEVGHSLGLVHCSLYRCGLNGYNNLADLDLAILDLCPEDLAKMIWVFKLDPIRRYEALLEWEKNQIPELFSREKQIWEKALLTLKPAEKPLEKK